MRQREYIQAREDTTHPQHRADKRTPRFQMRVSDCKSRAGKSKGDTIHAHIWRSEDLAWSLSLFKVHLQERWKLVIPAAAASALDIGMRMSLELIKRIHI